MHLLGKFKSLCRSRGGHAGRPASLHGEDGVRALGHRAYVGGLWEEVGRLQFDFMVARGLRPHHYFLDIACGSLRGGVHLIPYLEPGHYLGIDKERLLIEEGVERELGAGLFEAKRPQFVVSADFEFERFEARPDFALAQSLFTHLPPPIIERCLEKLRPAIAEGGGFYATYLQCAGGRVNPEEPDDHGRFEYSLAEMEAFGRRHGWAAECIGDWGHPRGQFMMKYIPA